MPFQIVYRLYFTIRQGKFIMKTDELCFPAPYSSYVSVYVMRGKQRRFLFS